MKKVLQAICLVIVIIVFRNWIIAEYITGGDWPFFYPEFFEKNPILPQSWTFYAGNGFGGKILSFSLDSYLSITHQIGYIIGLKWNVTYKVLWFGLFVVLSYFGIYKLSKKIFPESYSIISSLIYTTNTYILMVVGGGQMGIALSYGLAPWVIYSYINLTEKFNLAILSRLSLVLGTLLAFDIRIFIVTVLIVFITHLFDLHKIGNNLSLKLKFSFKFFILPLTASIVLNSFWLLPNLMNPYNPIAKLGAAYTSVASLKFFSFATLSNSISLYHPNWPQNIFGKIEFQHPEFLFIPLLVFASALFVRKKDWVIRLIVIALIGIFLAKGSNDPLGQVYIFLFEKIPVFTLFRDSTKWYLLIALSYSILIPFVLFEISKRLPKFKNLIPLLFMLVWILLIRESIFSTLNGTFKNREIPAEYLNLSEKLQNETNFSRVLWVPSLQRFGYSDSNHPAVEASVLFKATDAASLRNALENRQTKDFLKTLSIGYVVVPFDSLGEIFINDRKYSTNKRNEYINALDSSLNLKKITDDKITIYKTENYRGLFTINGKDTPYKRISDTSYEIGSISSGTLFFIQNYHKNWKVLVDDITIDPKITKGGFISFKIPEHKGKIAIVFSEQSIYNKAWIITLAALTVCVFLIFKKNK